MLLFWCNRAVRFPGVRLNLHDDHHQCQLRAQLEYTGTGLYVGSSVGPWLTPFHFGEFCLEAHSFDVKSNCSSMSV